MRVKGKEFLISILVVRSMSRNEITYSRNTTGGRVTGHIFDEPDAGPPSGAAWK
jgi:hypothetical protein